MVITGASSGLGRAAALEFTRHGARLVLAARRAKDLEDTAQMCRAAGGEAVVVVADVTSEEAMKRLGSEACKAFGHIDVWVNNAGVTLFAPLTEGPFDEHRRVIETNLFGSMLGAREAIPRFRAQGHGILINVGSVLSKVGQPFVPSYCASKFGIRGFTEALQSELADEPTIRVCSIYPFALNTPHFQVGANAIGRRVRAMPPMQTPEKVAIALVGLALRPRREVYVPSYITLGIALSAIVPSIAERLLLRALKRWHFDSGIQHLTAGNLYKPVETGKATVHGKRGPQLTTLSFVLWSAAELLNMAADSFRAPARLR